MSKDHYEENDERMNIIGQNGNDGLHYEEAAYVCPETKKKWVKHREACEKIADMEVESMSVEELKQYVYEELVETMYNCSDVFEYHAEKWEWTNE